MSDALLAAFTSAPYLVSFLAGIITFLSPCVLPLIPAYLSYISGLSLAELKDDEKMSSSTKTKVLTASLLFIAGFSLIFILLGAAASTFIGEWMRNQYVAVVAGVIIIIFGLHVMHAIDIKFLNYEQRADFGGMKKSEMGMFRYVLNFFAPFLLGMSFALGWTPCVGPLLGGILGMASFGDDTTQGTILMTLYAAGLGVPFFLSALLTSRAIGVMNKMKQHFKLIEIVAGSLLVLIGIAIATGGISLLTEFFLNLGFKGV